jgi:hypothetical protein
VNEANESGAPDSNETVTLENLVELQLAEGISIGEVALLEREYPGITVAVSRWFTETRE